MIARHEASVDKNDLWARLAAPLPVDSISWRQDGRATQRDGKFYARFVCYVDANTVRERLDLVVPGEWDLTLELMPTITTDDEAQCSFKARLQILGVIREDVGTGRDYKSAATDAFKRAAVRFGIAHELYSFDQNWVQVDGDGRFAKPLEDPAVAYARRQARKANGTNGSNGTNGRTTRGGENNAAASPRSSAPSPTGESTPAPESPAYPPGDSIDDRAPLDGAPSDEPSCPKCGGRMWDNRLSKRTPKAPDFRCRNKSCDGVIWPISGKKAYQQEDLTHTPQAAPRPAEEVLADDSDQDRFPF